MTNETKAEDRWLAAYEAVEKELPGRDAPWLQKLRRRALDRFQELGFPTPKQEAWKYTNVSPITKTPYEPLPRDQAGAVAEDALAPYGFEGLKGARIVFVDGRHAPGLDRGVDSLPDGVRVESLATLLDEDPKSVEPYLAQYAGFDENPFAALNVAFLQDGAFIQVPDGAVVEEPIHVLYVSTAPDGGAPAVSTVRTLVVAGDNSQATVVESYGSVAGAEEGQYLTNAATEIVAGDNAVVDHYRIQREGDAAHHVSNNALQLARDSNVRTNSFSLGGRLVRNDLSTALTAEGGNATMNGLFALRGKQHVDNHTRIDHLAPHCDSREYYKGVLDEQARGVFYGLIYVAKGAQQTDSYQHNPNLILSGDALVDSTPGLEIYADDVKCSHGSTIGQIDEQQLFYLMSRGLDRATARSLLVYAFAGEVVDRVKPAPVREKLQELVIGRLEGGDVVREAIAESGEAK